ncbi:hypothetical protein E1A91_A07G127800v1 [Gossypium mustelinum]|uniref:Arogenate dehydratase n=1 Tax=Gossypium mustelinum TaxID=34275 RepID=A0A5D2YK82_GOSMU|nr:hypothetical protein E1A91_A07G127800v1 [Gossypium mustelinum]
MATATSIVRSPAALLFAKVTVSGHKPTPTIQISRFPSKRSCFTALLSSLHDNNNDDDNNNNNNNVISHPKPLSSSQLFNSVSNGSRLRVAYQGVRGAYSEAAAEKAYPNCEAVPCDQFDSAFQALAQCENTLTKIGLSREAVDDTALAAKHVALHKLKDTGAVASSSAAKIYGLNILAQNIQDDCDNVTRFLILAREPIIPGIHNPFKTSIVFSLEEGPGVLFKALAVFALRQINLTKIESRPLRNQPLRAADDNNGSNIDG